MVGAAVAALRRGGGGVVGRRGVGRGVGRSLGKVWVDAAGQGCCLVEGGG